MRRRIAALGCLLALAAGGCAPRPLNTTVVS